jgi:hypothetical protein
MVVIKGQLEYVSPYSAGSSSADDMTTGQFEYYLVQASEVMDEIDTGVPTTTKSYCTLLLVAHLYECSQGRTGFSSEGIGDYSYSRIPGVLTSFKQQVQDICNNYGGGSAYQAEAGTRSDRTLPGPFTLDAEEQRYYTIS